MRAAARISVASMGLLLVFISAGSVSATSLHATAGPGGFESSRAFAMGAGRSTRIFTMRERSGVILLNQLTVPDGVRVMVEAELRAPALNGPGKVVAGARVTSWQVANDPALSCRHVGTSQVCTQGEEACPVPQAAWHFRLVKLGGPTGTIRFDYVVAPPPGAYRWRAVPWSSVLFN